MTDLFAPTNRRLNDQLRRVQVVRCGDCSEEIEFVVGAGKSHMNDDTIMRKARNAGWEFRRGGRAPRCPGCSRQVRGLVAVRAVATRPAEVRAALDASIGRASTDAEFTAAADVMNVEAVLTEGAPSLESLTQRLEESGAGPVLDAVPFPAKQEPPPMRDTAPAAASPRQPSREDKRRILDKLTEEYVSEEIGYSGDWSDEKVAAALSVPRAWVTDLRIEFHGENAGNENGSKAKRERDRAINELRQDIGGVARKIDGALATIAEAERALDPLKARLAKLEAGS